MFGSRKKKLIQGKSEEREVKELRCRGGGGGGRGGGGRGGGEGGGEQYLYELKWYVEEVKERYRYMSLVCDGNRLSVPYTDCYKRQILSVTDKNLL